MGIPLKIHPLFLKKEKIIFFPVNFSICMNFIHFCKICLANLWEFGLLIKFPFSLNIFYLVAFNNLIRLFIYSALIFVQKCPICNRDFTEAYLKNHLKKHQAESKFLVSHFYIKWQVWRSCLPYTVEILFSRTNKSISTQDSERHSKEKLILMNFFLSLIHFIFI